jgi:hypothetical protein
VIDKLDSQYAEVVRIENEIEKMETDLAEIKSTLKKDDEKDRELSEKAKEFFEKARESFDQLWIAFLTAKGSRGGAGEIEVSAQTCPICGRTDRKWSGNIHTVCGVSSEAKDGVWDITLKYLEGHNKLFYAPSRSNSASSVGRIIIKGKACSFIKNKNITCISNCDELTSEDLARVKTLIISSTADVDIDEYALSKFLDKTRAVLKIVFASGVQFVSGGKLSGWNYDSQNRILIRTYGD